jgi:hypothetical protein
VTAQQQQFLRAGEQFVAQTRQHEDVIGIILTGSFVHGQLDLRSDLDVFVILNPACNYRERGNTWIDGVEVEYFMNPPQQIRAYFHREKSPHTAHMLAHGKLAYCTSEVVVQLIEEARALMKEKPQPIQLFEIELAKYHIDDQFKDLEDCWAKADHFAGELLKTSIVNTAIDLFCKWHRLHRDKHKRLKAQLYPIDPIFPRLLETTLEAAYDHKETLLELKKYLTELLGGARSREWKLRSGLDL